MRVASMLRLVSALILAGGCIALADAVFASSAAAGAQIAVRNYEIVYRAAPDADNGPGTLHVWFSMPGNWRVETRTTKVNQTVVAAGDSVFTYDRAKNAVLWQARDQVGDCSSPVSIPETDLSRRWKTWQQAVAATRKAIATQWKRPTARTRILGRACDVYEQSVQVPADVPEVARARIGAIKFRCAIDTQLLAPLRYEELVDGRLSRKVEATAVKVNSAAPARRFKPPQPRGARVFKGALSQVPDLRLLAGTKSEPLHSRDLMSSLRGFEQPMNLYMPTDLPAGFALLSTSYSHDEEWFEVTAELVARSGASMVIQQNRKKPLPSLPGSTPITFDGKHGEIVERAAPFQRVVLTWREEDCQVRIDAAGVSRAQVLQVAASARKRQVPPSAEEMLTNVAAAQAKVHFLILTPKVLPRGFSLTDVTVTPYKKNADGSYTPEQISISYASLGGGGWVNLNEMRGEFETTVSDAEQVEIGGHTAWYTYRKQFGHEFTWVQDGTEVNLSGDLAKSKLLVVARSMAPADPSARERIKTY